MGLVAVPTVVTVTVMIPVIVVIALIVAVALAFAIVRPLVPLVPIVPIAVAIAETDVAEFDRHDSCTMIAIAHLTNSCDRCLRLYSSCKPT